jgi:hypothetical protein
MSSLYFFWGSRFFFTLTLFSHVSVFFLCSDRCFSGVGGGGNLFRNIRFLYLYAEIQLSLPPQQPTWGCGSSSPRTPSSRTWTSCSSGARTCRRSPPSSSVTWMPGRIPRPTGPSSAFQSRRSWTGKVIWQVFPLEHPTLIYHIVT